MKVLYIHQYFATPRGSAGTRSFEIASRLARSGHEVTIVTSNAQLRADEVPPGDGAVRTGKIGDIPVIVLSVPYSQKMGFARRLVAFAQFMLASSVVSLRARDVDLVYATSTPLSVGVPALITKWLRKTPFAFEVRDLWPDVPIELGFIRNSLAVRLLHMLEEVIYNQAEFIVAINDDVAGIIRSRLRDKGKDILVVPNACDTHLFSPQLDGEAFRRVHKLERKVVAVHTGTMGHVNGCEAIIDAAEQCADLKDLVFVLVGRGAERERLEERARSKGIENVLFLDSMPKEDLAAVLATADIGLMTVMPAPVLEMNCANKYFDYLASGLPVILNYQGWQADLLARHRSGLSAPQGDLGAFVDRIRTLAGSLEMRREFSTNARSLAETSLSRDSVLRPLLAKVDDMTRAEDLASHSGTRRY